MQNAEGKQKSRLRVFIILWLEILFFVFLVIFLVLRINYYFSFASPKPDIVIFLIDALRADSLGCYGHDIPTSPFIDSVARDGVLFEDVHSQSSWTKPSVASLFTSMYISQHRIMEDMENITDGKGFPRYAVLSDDFVTLPEVFNEKGYHTAAFVTNYFIYPMFNFDQGFDDFFMISQADSNKDGKKVVILNLPAENVHRRLKQFLLEYYGSLMDRLLAKAGIHKKPLFLYVHYMDVHGPYNPPYPYTNIFDETYAGRPDIMLSKLEMKEMGYVATEATNLNYYFARYDAQIRYLDDALKELLAWTEEKNVLHKPIMVFTSDHGEAFGEHKRFTHRGPPYEEVTKIPLIIKSETLLPRGVRVSAPIQLIDLGPTLLAMAGITAPDQFEGKDFSGLINGKKMEKSEIWSESTEIDKPWVTFYDGRLKWYLDMDAGEIFSVYDLEDDPSESTDIIETILPELRAKKRRYMQQWRKKMSEKVEINKVVPQAHISDDIKARLKALGYAQ